MYCVKCGNQITDNIKFCSRCGTARKGQGFSGAYPNNTHQTYSDQKYADQKNAKQNYTDQNYTNQKYTGQKYATYSGAKQNDKSNKSGSKKFKWFIVVGIALLLAVIVVGGFALHNQRNERNFRDAVASGNRYLVELNFEQAEAAFLRAIEINPREVEPYLQLADMYMEWDKPEEAIAILEQGLEAVSEDNREALEDRAEEIDEIISGENEETVDDEIANGENLYDFVWVLEPSIEADDINYVMYRSEVSNMSRRQFQSPHAVIRRGDTFGLIDP